MRHLTAGYLTTNNSCSSSKREVLKFFFERPPNTFNLENMIEQAAETAKTNVIFNRLFSKVLSEEDLSDYNLT